MKLMKLGFTIIIILLACACASVGADTESVQDTLPQSTEVIATTAPTQPHTEAEEVTAPFIPDLLHITSTTYDPESRIQRTTLDTQGLDLIIYFEIPVFEETTEGYRCINVFLQELSDRFFSPDDPWENDDIMGIWEAAAKKPLEDIVQYGYERRAIINTQTEEFVSVTICYQWFSGGVADYGSDSYTFSVSSGELLTLSDLVDESDEQIKNAIMDALREKDAGSGEIYLEQIEQYAVDDFEFTIYDGELWILFDKYEASYGAYGGFDILLPLKITYAGTVWRDSYAELLRQSECTSFALGDVDGDGIPELFVGGQLAGSNKHAEYDVYTFVNGLIGNLGRVGTLRLGSLWLDGEGGILGYDYGAGAGEHYRYYIENDRICFDDQTDGYYYDNEGNLVEWFRGLNGNAIVVTEENIRVYQGILDSRSELKIYNNDEMSIQKALFG